MPFTAIITNEQNRTKFAGALPLVRERGLFLDLGCEQGQWLAMAAEAGFRRCMGVDMKLWPGWSGVVWAYPKTRFAFIQAVIPDELSPEALMYLAFQFGGTDRISLLKIDIEGAEKKMMLEEHGFRALLASTEVVNMETHGSDDDHSAGEAWLEARGWTQEGHPGNYVKKTGGIVNIQPGIMGER